MEGEAGPSVFDREAARYDRWFEENEPLFEAEVRALRRAVRRPERGLEVGVGTGRFAAALGVPVGVDPSRPMLLRARARGLLAVQGVGERLPFAAACFELVLLTTTVCFLSDLDLTAEEARRVLSPGGRIVIGMIDAESWLGRRYARRKSPFYEAAVFHAPGWVGKALRGAGFRSPSYLQTLFEFEGEVKRSSMRIEPGRGEGGFVVLWAER